MIKPIAKRIGIKTGLSFFLKVNHCQNVEFKETIDEYNFPY